MQINYSSLPPMPPPTEQERRVPHSSLRKQELPMPPPAASDIIKFFLKSPLISN